MAEWFARRGRRRHFYAVVIALRFSVQVSRVDGFQAAPFEQLEIAVSLTPADYGSRPFRLFRAGKRGGG